MKYYCSLKSSPCEFATVSGYCSKSTCTRDPSLEPIIDYYVKGPLGPEGLKELPKDFASYSYTLTKEEFPVYVIREEPKKH